MEPAVYRHHGRKHSRKRRAPLCHYLSLVLVDRSPSPFRRKKKEEERTRKADATRRYLVHSPLSLLGRRPTPVQAWFPQRDITYFSMGGSGHQDLGVLALGREWALYPIL